MSSHGRAVADLADMAPGELQAAVRALDGLSAVAVIGALLARGDLEARKERDRSAAFKARSVVYRLTPGRTA